MSPPLARAFGSRSLEGLVRDLRLAARSLARTPGFAVLTVAPLALGLALTACTLAVVNAYLLRSMPYPDSERLHHVSYATPGEPEPRGLSAMDWRALSDLVELADSSTPTRLHLVDGAYPQEAMGLAVAPGSVEALGLRAWFGRGLDAGDYAPTAERVALIGHDLWRQRFRADSQAIGRTFRARLANIAGEAALIRIVGVLPPGYRYAREHARGDAEFVLPLRAPMRTYLIRLRAGVPAAVAQERIEEAVRAVATSLPHAWAGVRLESVHARYVDGLRPVLMAIILAAALVLLIVCANVAVLTMLRAMRRQKEVAVRVALGAGRLQILRLLVAESGLICGGALALGLIVTAFALRWLGPVVEERLGRDAPGGTGAISVDPTVLLGVGIIGVLAAVALSFIPLLAPWQHRLADTLRSAGRVLTDGSRMRRMRSALVALEVAAALALLVGGGLMIRTVMSLLGTELGFETRGVQRARIALPAGRYPHDSLTAPFYERLQDGLNARLGQSFALANVIPFFQAPKQTIDADSAGTGAHAASMMGVGTGYFATLGIRIVAGRSIDARDRKGTEAVVVISQSLARRLWPDGVAIGRRLRTAERSVSGAPPGAWRTVVGVARDVRQAFTDGDLLDAYIPFLQAPGRYAPLYVRTSRPAPEWLDAVRATVAEVDPDALVAPSPSLEEESRRLLAGPRFLMTILSGFAANALALALLGIYGVTAYAVQQREREVAIRMALGATAAEVTALLVRSGGAVITVGLAFGMLGAVGISHVLRNQLYGVTGFDLPTLLAGSAVLALACLVATWWPARRAARTSPMGVLNET